MTNPPTGPQSATAASLDLMFSPTWVAAHSELISSYLSQQSSPPADVQRLHRQASEGYDSWDLLPTIKAPTLVIHGSEDRVAPPANAYLLAERIPHAELYIVNGGRHGYFVEFREEASRVVNEFLARHPL